MSGVHREQRGHLEEVVLDHVAQAASGLVERSTALNAELLGQCDLDRRHVVAVPDRLQEGVGEAEVEQVHDRLLTEEMVDPEDRILGKHRSRDPVELPRGGQVATERLLDDDASAVCQASAAQPFDHGPKQRRRDCEVVGRTSSFAERPLECREGAWVVVVTIDVAEKPDQPVERSLVVDPACRPARCCHGLAPEVCRDPISSGRRRSPAQPGASRFTIA
jgi:hypothetical protein